MRDGSPSLKGQALRFLIVGGLNTLLTYAIFITLGLVMAPWIAYTIAFAAGLIWTSLGSSRFVFRANFSLGRMLAFIGCYLVVYGLGRVIITLVDPRDFGDLLITSLVVLVCTTPLMFVIGRYVFGRRSSGDDLVEKGSLT